MSKPTISKLEFEVFDLHIIGKFEGLFFYLSGAKPLSCLLKNPPDNSTLKLFLLRGDRL